jgi:glutathione S-transferase
MLTVHHLAHSQSERIIWLCEEIQLPYELVQYEREPSGRAPEAYRALHPLQTAPIIADGELKLAESGAIVEYILRRYGNGQLLLGPEHPEFTDFLFWFHFANGSFVPALMIEHFQPKDVPPNPHTRGERAWRLIETRLSEATWFAGNTFTAADVMMSLPRFVARRDLSSSPNTRAYLERLNEREAWRTAAAKAEPEGA